jgi:hypothetical protein
MNVKYYRPTNQTHNSFLINDQILFAEQFLDFQKKKKSVCCIVTGGQWLNCVVLVRRLTKIEMCSANQQHVFTVDGHAAVCRGEGRYGESTWRHHVIEIF